MANPILILSRRNLLTLLAKLDRVRDGGTSACTLLLPYENGPLPVQAVEDEVKYADREPGMVHPIDDPRGH